jgi:putative proteasome-type protease
MTYCVGMCLKDGLVMLSDSRTSAGVDNIATFRKMTVWERPDERLLCLLSAGNLGVTQTIVNHLEAGLDPDARKLTDMASMFHAAQLVGEAIRLVYRVHGKALEEMNAAAFNVSFLLGGQIRGGEHRLFEIYAAGNFIQASDRTPFLQIGEHKYGKPILDRALGWETELRAAAKLALISMDSTLRSNLSVGLPLDLLVYRRDAFNAEIRRTIDADDPYFRTIREGWSRSLREAHQRLPDVPW